MFSKKINAYWWSAKKLNIGKFENFGDILTKYLIEKITGQKVKWINIQNRNFFNLNKTVLTVTGSILGHIDEKCIVWGNGIMFENETIKRGAFYAVRGSLSQQAISKQHGIHCDVIGDPAILMPSLYKPTIPTRKYKVGIIPNYKENELLSKFDLESEEIVTINTFNNIEDIVAQIVSCEIILSSSLHGLIIAHVYQKPAIWVKISDLIFGDSIKYLDYYSSIEIYDISPFKIKDQSSLIQCIDEVYNNKSSYIVDNFIFKKIQKDLYDSFPHHIISSR